jgi:hypothetical protein
MNRAVLSLCLLGAGLATANVLIMQRPTCRSSGAEAIAAYKETSPPIGSAIQGNPTQAPKAGTDEPVEAPTANPARKKSAHTPKAATTKPAAALKDSDRTGSIDQNTKEAKSEKSATVTQRRSAEMTVTQRRSAEIKRRDEPRRYDWRRHYRYVGPPVYIGPPVGFAIRVYPGW